MVRVVSDKPISELEGARWCQQLVKIEPSLGIDPSLEKLSALR